MIGNDVVDLADPECAHLHPRFDERVFAAAERRRIAFAESPERMRWILWAAKESAFKRARRLDPSLPFVPRRFAVSLDAALEGVVHHPGGPSRVRVELLGDCAHAVATAPEADPRQALHAACRLQGADPSRAARALALRELARHCGCSERELRVEKVARAPQLRRRGALRAGPLSLSHHGRYVAYAAPAPGWEEHT